MDFLQDVSRLRIQAAMAVVAPDFVCRNRRGEAIWKRSEFAGLLEWFAQLGSVMACDGLEMKDGRARAELRVRNEFFELIGVVIRRFRLTFRLENGLIAEQVVEPLDTGAPSDVEALEPAIRWARTERPDALDELLPDGRIRYDGKSAERWVELLRDWSGSKQDG